jgi:hypothetical protein
MSGRAEVDRKVAGEDLLDRRGDVAGIIIGRGGWLLLCCSYAAGQLICPTGWIVDLLSRPVSKNFRFANPAA